MEIFPQLILVILLIVLNGFFAASEYALVAIRKTRIDELVKKGDFVAKLVQQALEDRENFISATQLGTTIVSLLLGWLGEPVIARIIISFFIFLPQGVASIVAHTLSIVIALFILTFISIIFGELVPKTIALYKAEMVAFTVITPLFAFVKIFKPFIRVLNVTGNFVIKRLGLNPPTDTQLVYSKDEIKIVLDQIQQSGAVKKDEFKIMTNVINLGDQSIITKMTPRTEISAIDINSPVHSLIKRLNPSYSRFPVYRKTLDDIVGFIHIKDVYKLVLETDGNKKLSQTNIIRKVISVPGTKKADEVLLDMRKKHVHLAVIYDEYGMMVGIVTLEDIIESLVGEIQDEFDRPIKGINRNFNGSYLVEGNTPLEKIQKRFRLPVKGQTYTTIGGLIFGILGREPHKGDEIQVGNLFFEIESVEGKRVKRLLLKRESKKVNNRALT